MKKVAFTINSFLVCLPFYAQNIAEEIASGLSNPVEIATAPTSSSEFYVVEVGGKIKVLNNSGNVLNNHFLDISGRVSQAGGERGLLGLAFSPSYATDSTFFVNYVRPNDNATVISKFKQLSALKGDSLSEQIILVVNQPYTNHKGGSIHFGPDNYLYIGMGDGGSSGDPENRSQNTLSLLGKMLRINVLNQTTYSIPADNPFVSNVLYEPEIWAVGLRNPWKFSFDQQNGNLWIADVGQNAWEEINVQLAASLGGENYGWRCYEGQEEFNTSSNCQAASNYTMPVFVYGHDAGDCSITGGYVYRGNNPNLNGKYVYGDYCSKNIYYLEDAGNQTFVSHLVTDVPGSISTFGQLSNGELLIGTLDGFIYKLNMETVSVSENTLLESVKVFPTLAQDVVTITFGEINQNIHVSTVDVNGKLIQKAVLKPFTQTFEMQISDLPAGVYFLQINAVNKIFTTKFVKI